MKFLMIDDDDYKITKMKPYFDGHELDVAMSYSSGLRKLVSNQYDGLILDMMFPFHDTEKWDIHDRNGINVLNELKRLKISVPTVIFSGNSEDVSAFKNVKEYILNDGCYIGDKVLKFIEYCKNNC